MNSKSINQYVLRNTLNEHHPLLGESIAGSFTIWHFDLLIGLTVPVCNPSPPGYHLAGLLPLHTFFKGGTTSAFHLPTLSTLKLKKCHTHKFYSSHLLQSELCPMEEERHTSTLLKLTVNSCSQTPPVQIS